MLRFRTTTLPVFLLVLGCLALLSTLPGRAQDIPPGTPPDIAAIMRKINKGGKPTMADIAKLQAWSKAIVGKMNVPNAFPTRPHTPSQAHKLASQSSTLQGIPCKIVVTVSYDGKDSTSGESEMCNYSMSASAALFPRIDGTGDYFGTMLNPDAHVSSFQFALPIKNGQLIKGGSGTYFQRVKGPKGSDTITGHCESTAAAFTLATTGKGDNLFGLGGVGCVVKGTQVTTDPDRTLRSNYRGAGGGASAIIGAPFFAEANGPKPQPGSQTPAATMNLSYKKLVAAIQSGKTATVTGSERVAFDKGSTHCNGTATLVITLRPKPIRLIIEPVDTKIYTKWMPMPDADECGESTYFGHPKPLQVHLVLQDGSKPPAPRRGTLTVPNTTIGGRLTATLGDVSSGLGFCMNYPANAETKKGLFFPKEQPQGIRWLDDDHVETMSATVTEATVSVAARDTAAYGNIQAECPVAWHDVGIPGKADPLYVPAAR